MYAETPLICETASRAPEISPEEQDEADSEEHSSPDPGGSSFCPLNAGSSLRPE